MTAILLVAVGVLLVTTAGGQHERGAGEHRRQTERGCAHVSLLLSG